MENMAPQLCTVQKRNKTTVTELHMGQYNAYTYN